MIYLVTGGSGSGKSNYAEQLLLTLGEGQRIYIATMLAGNDPENLRRIEKHRQRRASMGFETIECPLGLRNIEIPEDSIVLLECMSNLVANEVFMEDGAGIHTVNEILAGLDLLFERARHCIVVTNEIFSDGIRYDNTTSIYMQFLGALNQEIARVADQVTEVVYGIPVHFKKEETMEDRALQEQNLSPTEVDDTLSYEEMFSFRNIFIRDKGPIE